MIVTSINSNLQTKMRPTHQPDSPRRNASLVSQLLFIWLLPLLYKGYRRPLQIQDLYHILPEDESSFLGDELEIAWNRELEKSENAKELGKKYKPSLWKALMAVFGHTFAAYGVFAFYEECVIKLVQPIVLGLLLRYFSHPTEYTSPSGPIFGMLVIIGSILYTSSDHPYTFAVQHVGMKIRVSLCSLIYRKALRMSRRTLEETTAGQIVNFLSSDMNRFDVLMTFLHYIWVAPLQFFIVIGILYGYLDIGWPCFMGLGLLIIFVPFQGLMGTIFSRLRSTAVEKTDRRLMLMEEILSAMRVIKMYAWEEAFAQSVNNARVGEVYALRKTGYCRAINQSLFYVTSRVTLFLTLLAYVLTGGKLTSETVFVVLSLYNAVQLVLTLFFPAAVISLAETAIAIRRFQDFLLLEEKPHLYLLPSVEESKTKSNAASVPAHSMKDNETEDNDSIIDDDPGETVDLKLDEDNPDESINESVKPQKLSLYISDTKIQHKRVKPSTIPLHPVDAHVVGHHITAQWDPKSTDMAFDQVKLNVQSGEILAIVGSVGSGKTSVLQAILGELPILSGELSIEGSMAYASQDPWVFNASVRDNILFGLDYVPEWYDEVIEACALSRDLILLPYGDRTIVGDRGTTLSGGQKARINLARAVYADRDIYLLDDPLSAVDPEVGQHLISHCIFGILRDKVRILVTHQLQYLPMMNKILILDDGFVKFYGTFKKLNESGIPYDRIVTQKKSSYSGYSGSGKSSRATARTSATARLPPSGQTSAHTAAAGSSSPFSSTTLALESTGKNPLSSSVQDLYMEHVISQYPGSAVPANPRAIPLGNKQPLVLEHDLKDDKPFQEQTIIDEEMPIGGFGWGIYWIYFSGGSTCWAVLLVIFLAIITQTVFTCSDFWLQFWIDAEKEYNGTNSTGRNDNSFIRELKTNRDLQISVYTMLIVTLFTLALLRTMDFYRICMETSVEFHKRLFVGVIRSPMWFFDNNPLGRILNRFAKDISILDETLPSVLFDTFDIFMHTIGVIVVVSIASPIMLLPSAIMLLAFYIVRNFYFPTGRAIKRLEGIARSPLFSSISTTLYGLPTIRAFGAEAMFKKQFETHLDVHSSVWYLFLATSRWLGIIIDWIAIFFVIAVLINCFLDRKDDAVAGLSLTSAMMLTSMMQWGIRQSTELANQMVNVERILEYCNLRPEAELESHEEYRPPLRWPYKGEIKMHNVSMRYDPSSPVTVLKNVNCTFRGGEKIGICGRTGAGKSSLIQAIFRLTEPNGEILIDGIEINKIGLHDLRRNISIIPQDPILFIGSIRYNLDPLYQFADAEVWSVLQEVGLKSAIRHLDYQVSDGGANFSTGQKQLICLARAILRNNKILIVDEATANVDPVTDTVIQQTLRKKCAHYTVITIAHRLNTIMDSDKVLVMDRGAIMEYDHPWVLLQNPNGFFTSMVISTGDENAETLRATAEHNFNKKRRKRSSVGRQHSRLLLRIDTNETEG